MGMHIPQYTQCSQEISLGVGRLPTWNVPTKLPSFPIASQGNAITNAVVRGSYQLTTMNHSIYTPVMLLRKLLPDTKHMALLDQLNELFLLS